MLTEEDRSFLNAYREVATISPERLPAQVSDDHFGLSRQDFYRELHIEDGIYEKLEEEILATRDQLIFLVGPRGSGKTTTGLYAVTELERLGCFMQWISIAEEEAKARLDDKSDILSYLRDQVRKHMREKLFQPWSADDEPLIRLVAFLLCEDQQETVRSLAFNVDFERQQTSLRTLMRVQKINFEDACRHILEHRNTSPILQEVLSDTRQQAEVQHLSAAIKVFFKTKYVVVWIDNVDAFPQEEQTMLINAIFSICRSDPINLRFVVAAREENLLRFDHFYEIQSEMRKAAVYITEDRRGGAKSGMHMPNLSRDKFKKIVEKRFDFAREFQKKIEEQVAELPADASELQLREMQRLRERYGPMIRKIRNEHLKIISDKACDAIVGERILHLFNNSIRQLLPLHSDFMEFLVGIGYGKDEYPLAFHFDESFMRTQLLFWLCTMHGAANNEFRYFNIVRYTRENLGGQNSDHSSSATGCFLPFLTLSCIWNLCLNNRVRRDDTFEIPTIERVITNLQYIGYSSEEIKQTILRLYNPNSEYTMFVVIETRDRITQVQQLESTHRIRITYKGKAALASLSNSFGFLYAMKFISDNSPNAHNALEKNRLNEYFAHLLPELKKIGKMHLNSLCKIRQQPRFAQRADWLDLYLQDFGVPLENGFRRSNSACRGLGSEPKRVLYFDSLIHSIESYARESKSRKLDEEISKLINSYRQLLSRVEKGEMLPGEEYDLA